MIINWKNESENLRKYFEEDHMLLDDVAKLYNVSTGTIRNKCRIFKIKITPNKKVVLTKEQKQEFLNLFKSGVSKEELKQKFNLHDNAYYDLLSKLKLRRKERSIWTEEEINELRDLLNNKNDYDYIVSVFKDRHSSDSIFGIIRDRGKYLNLKYQGSKRHKTTEEESKEIIKLYRKDGLTYEEIINRFDGVISDSCIRKVLKRNDAVLSNDERINLGHLRGKGKLKVKLTKDLIVDTLKKNNYVITETAKELGVSKDTIKRRMVYFKIERPIKEKVIPKISHRFHLLEKFLGHKPKGKERKLKLLDVISKDIVESAFILNKYDNKQSSKYLGISESLFIMLKSKYKIIDPTKVRLSDFSEEYLKDLYIDKGLNQYEIAEITGLKPETLRKYLSKKFPEKKKNGRYSSNGELLVAKALEKLGIKFKYNKHYVGYNTDFPSRSYYIDFEFAYNNKLYWIEYNGEQHYRYVEYFFKTRENFEYRQERDRFVSEELTKIIGTDLIIIKYTYNTFDLVLNKIKDSLGII